jgi:DNA-directed RNA polymerase subunit E'/Rpb7
MLNEKIKLEPAFINKGYKNELIKRLKKKVEAVCSRHGYIKKGSIEIYKIAPGVIDATSLNGSLVFNIYFYADICNPTLGCVVKCKVSNINKFGILAESGYQDDDKADYINVLEIFIAKNSVNIASEVDLETVQIGQELFVEILGKKFELNDKKVTTIGRVVVEKSSKSSKTLKAIEKKEEDDENENEEEYEDSGNEAPGSEEDEDNENDDSEYETEEVEEEEEEENEEEIEEENEDDEKSSKGGFFSDDEFFEDEDEYGIFGDDNQVSDEDEEDDD